MGFAFYLKGGNIVLYVLQMPVLVGINPYLLFDGGPIFHRQWMHHLHTALK